MRRLIKAGFYGSSFAALTGLHNLVNFEWISLIPQVTISLMLHTGVSIASGNSPVVAGGVAAATSLFHSVFEDFEVLNAPQAMLWYGLAAASLQVSANYFANKAEEQLLAKLKIA